MRRIFRRWRLRVWSARLHTRELQLEAFNKSPFRTLEMRTDEVKGKLENRVAKATYKVSVITALLRPPLPEALAMGEGKFTR